MSNVITTKDLAEAMDRVRTETVEKSMLRIESTEPELCGFIKAAVNCMAGRLALCDVPNIVVRDTAIDTMELIAACLIANRIGVDRLFEESDPFDPLDGRSSDGTH
jgi:hypothetical protein